MRNSKRATASQLRIVRQSYLNGDGSLRALSEAHGIPKRTLERHAQRGRWREERDRLGGIVTQSAAEVAAKEYGSSLALDATSLVSRTLQEAKKWMDRIEHLAESPDLDADSVRKLVAAWRASVGAGREALRLDAPESSVMINVFSRPVEISAEPIHQKTLSNNVE
ncbi:MAG: hypothetical protein EXS31_09715 [Pedosphaera sp.]|nr:hypothetical protein [Pedosphaera sp.]